MQPDDPRLAHEAEEDGLGDAGLPLAPDDAAWTRLKRTLKNLSLPPQEGSASPAKVTGRKFVFPANDRKLESVTLDSDANNSDVTLLAQLDGVERRIVCGRGTWQKGQIAWGLDRLVPGAVIAEQPVAASGAWTANDIFTAKLCFYETPYIVTIRLKFSDQELQYDCETNVGFGPTKEPQLVGKVE